MQQVNMNKGKLGGSFNLRLREFKLNTLYICKKKPNSRMYDALEYLYTDNSYN